MLNSLKSKTGVAALVFIFAALLIPSSPKAADSLYTLNNGMKVILKENHGSPMIASVIFVKSGSKYESQYENGITHFLEHLLFDGTTHMDREQLDESIRNLGGYINAFTRKDLTAYLVLMPRQYIDYGLAVQADMLFNSTIPDSELPKERRVVIEEINRDADAPGAPAEDFFTSKAYAGTDYGRPVLGYRAFIQNIPREAIIDYWKRYYEPSNMTALVIGDFDTPQMKLIIDSTLGSIMPPADSTASIEQAKPDDAGETDALTGQNLYDTVANVKSTYIDFSFSAPKYSDSDYLAMDLLSQYLNMSGVSPLAAALTGGADPLASEASVSLVTHAGFSRLEVNVVTDKSDKADTIVSTILNEIESLDTHVADKESIEGIKTSVKAQDIYTAEK
ncbi:MAG TPA: pitrilysin family protein, partial [candidate division Zixibacteria bacterium]|nr:pitrilysin family protein [candidate division Zixibacteria bacterium]